MSKIPVKSVIYFEEAVFKTLAQKASYNNCTMSDLVNDAVKVQLQEDLADMEAFTTRADEENISYSELLKRLRL